jgi:hypothetical protein
MRRGYSPSLVHLATARCFEGALSDEELEALTEGLSGSQDLTNGFRDCLIVGYGGQMAASYAWLEQTLEVDSLWYGWWGPWWTGFLFWFAVGHGGVVRVNEPSVAKDIFGTLSSRSTVELYSFGRQYREAVEDHVQRKTWQSEIGIIVGDDPSYFCLGVEDDSLLVSSGKFAWCTFGAECPLGLHSVVTGETQ